MGVSAVVHPEAFRGEAGEVGRALAARWQDDPGTPVVHVIGGETTVTVTGGGAGGRNQEMALSAALALDASRNEAWARNRTIRAAGSDGIDGPTAAAGAVCDVWTVREGARMGLSATECLARNDSHGWFSQAGGLVVTGPTHVNVMDLVLVLQDSPGSPRE